MSKHNRTITEARLQSMHSDIYKGDKLLTISKLTESIKNVETVFSDNPLIQYDYVKNELSTCLFHLIGLFGQCDTNISELAEIVTNNFKKE